MTTQNNQVSALEVTVAVAVGIFMVGKATYEIYAMLGRFAYRCGRYVGKKYYASEYYNPMVSEVTEAVTTEATVITDTVGQYICGWVLFASSIHALYLYIRRFDYVESVYLEAKVRSFAVDIWKRYVRACGVMV